MLFQCRKDDAKLGAFAKPTVAGNRSVAAFDDAIDHGKPQASPFADLFGCKEGVEDPFANLRRNALSGVLDR